jgi:hypothetical protein
METRKRPPPMSETSTVGPWEASLKIQEHPPLTQKNIDNGVPGPCGGSNLHPGSERCVVNLHGYHR